MLGCVANFESLSEHGVVFAVRSHDAVNDDKFFVHPALLLSSCFQFLVLSAIRGRI